MVSDDGYITQLIRILNPLVDLRKQPPVMMFHGGLIDTRDLGVGERHPAPPRGILGGLTMAS